MKREIKTTLDGSKTLYINDLNEHYRSHNGAIQEAEHVFIKNGLKNVVLSLLKMHFKSWVKEISTKNKMKPYQIYWL